MYHAQYFLVRNHSFLVRLLGAGRNQKSGGLSLRAYLRTNLSRRFFAYGFRYAAEPKKLCPRSTPAAAQRTQRTVTNALSPCLCAGPVAQDCSAYQAECGSTWLLVSQRIDNFY